MSVRTFSLVLLAIAAAIIAGAWGFQVLGHIVPCELCLYQRWPWYIAIVLSVLVALRPSLPAADYLPTIMALLFAASAGLALYHVGVEHHVFAGPAACTAPSSKGASLEELTQQLLATPVVQCDKVQWSLVGISLAGWNFLASLGVAGLTVWARRKVV